MLTEKHFTTGELTLNYAEGPESGTPLVLIHGGTSRWQTFEPVLDRLAPSYHIFAPDLRGHGRSNRASSYRIERYIADIIAFVSMIGQPVYLLGHSLGALVALGVAADHPAMVRKLILEDPPFFGTDNDRFNKSDRKAVFSRLVQILETNHSAAEIEAALNAAGQMPPAAVAARAETLALLDPDVARAFVERRNINGFNYLSCLQRLAMPTMLLRADPNVRSACEERDVEVVQQTVSDITYQQILGAGHGIHEDAPEQFLEAITTFL